MITYNIAYYEATAENMTVYYNGHTLADYTIERRAERLDSFVEYYAPDVLALQEVNRLWWPYLISNKDSLVNDHGYRWAGNLSATGRKDGIGAKDNDLYNLLLWNPEKYEEAGQRRVQTHHEAFQQCKQGQTVHLCHIEKPHHGYGDALRVCPSLYTSRRSGGGT